MPFDSAPKSSFLTLRFRLSVAVAIFTSVVLHAACGSSAIHLDRLDNFIEIVGDLHCPGCIRGAADAAMAQYLLERLLVGAVIGDGRGWGLVLMPGQDAHGAIAGADDP